MNPLQSDLYRKYGRVAVYVARDLLALRPGDRIRRIQDYAQQCETGNGTVQNALRSLADSGAVRLEPRGHQGTFILEMDYRLLREISGLSSLLGLMPLPYTRRYEGLASGLYDSFRQSDLSFSLGYMRGARNRLQALKRGQGDFVVLSGLAAELAEREGGVRQAMRFGLHTYVGGHGILLAQPDRHEGIVDGMRVGVDPLTLDQQWLTQEECRGKQVELVEVAYSHLLDRLRGGQIDAAIWNLDELPQNSGVGVRPLQSATAGQMAERNTEAVIVMDAGRPDLERLLPELVDQDAVAAIQQEVVEGRRIPSY